MIIDKALELSEKQALTSTGSTNSTNTLDFGKEGDEVAKSLNLLIQVEQDADFASSGAATLAASIQTSDDNSNWTTLLSLPAVGLTALKKGARPWGFMKVPYGVKRYLKVVYTIGTAAMTAGKVWAVLTPSLEVK
jgi:hypothetical protein